MSTQTAGRILAALKRQRLACDRISFARPVHTVYNPYDYAWDSVRLFVETFATGPRRVLFLGMNPGPWGMAQTGVPFGEVAAVRDWMGLAPKVRAPANQHPARPVEGLACPRSEVSGRRFWGLMSARFKRPAEFFRGHFVLNYCPLMFVSATGANLTPDKLPAREQHPLLAACDAALADVIAALRPEVLVGVGGFAETALRRIAPEARVVRLLHPSPASPAANRDWAGAAVRQLVAAGVWS